MYKIGDGLQFKYNVVADVAMAIAILLFIFLFIWLTYTFTLRYVQIECAQSQTLTIGDKTYLCKEFKDKNDRPALLLVNKQEEKK